MPSSSSELLNATFIGYFWLAALISLITMVNLIKFFLRILFNKLMSQQHIKAWAIVNGLFIKLR